MGQPKGNASSLALVILALLVAAAVVATVAWMSLIRNPAQQYLEERQGELIKLTGLGAPVTNSMDARYTDADGDLLADAPADVAKVIDPAVLNFSYVPVEDSTQFKQAFADLLAHIGKQTGKTVQYTEFESVEAQLKALRDGTLHIAGFNTGGVPIAVNAAGFVPVSLLAGEESAGFYKMQIIARADSPIARLTDLRGRQLTLTDPSSNSGYKAPLVLLQDHGMQPGRDYEIRYSGSQDASIEGIASGEYAAAAVASDVLRRAIGEGKIKESDFRVIHESSDFPSAALGYAHNLKPDLAAKVRQSLADFNWSGTSLGAYFANAGQSRFSPADYRKDWELVRRIDNEIGYAHRLAE